MGGMLRSELMTICDIDIQEEAAFEVLTCVGDMSCVQFVDMNPELKEFQKRHASELSRCAEMERKLLDMESVLNKDDIYISDIEVTPEPMQPNEMPLYEVMLGKWENDLLEISKQEANTLKNYLQLSEMYYVVDYCASLLEDAEITNNSILFRLGGQGAGDTGQGTKLFVITGAVKRDRCLQFEMMLWRVSRGNMYYKQAAHDSAFEDPRTGQGVRKVAFLAGCQGDKLNQDFLKVCSGFRVNTYPAPNTLEERTKMTDSVRRRIRAMENHLARIRSQKHNLFSAVGQQWRTYDVQIKKAQAIYHTMNLFKLDKGRLMGKCWVPTHDLISTQEKLDICLKSIGSTAFLNETETDATPPTYNRTNKFTKGFQALINAYGEPAYRELNPAPYTLITFPFLFSLMFGDMGHGLILVIFASWMLIREKVLYLRSNNEIWNIIFGGRYVIFMLGLFSIYTGFAYNVVFSKPLLLMSPYWINDVDGATLGNKSYFNLKLNSTKGPIYLFGMDPLTKLSETQLSVETSLKMKLSFIVGVIHMFFGLILSLFNHIYFKKTYAIFLQFIPQVLFLLSLFMWLIIMIYVKWFKFRPLPGTEANSERCAPQLLLALVDTILFSKFGFTSLFQKNCPIMFVLYQIQLFSFIVSVLCIIVLLFGTPLYKLNKNEKLKIAAMKRLNNYKKREHVDTAQEKKLRDEISKYSVTFGDLIILQSFHTINYVLSTIYHAASYLRLWALSFAHAHNIITAPRYSSGMLFIPVLTVHALYARSIAYVYSLQQGLTEIAWLMILKKLALADRSTTGAFKLVIVFAIWAAISVALLVIMEGLSIFGHTLRLHWFEFMSKFYINNGCMFRPFSFKNILCEDEETSDYSNKKEKNIIA